MKKIAIYSPYVPKHSGGGERYLLSIAEALSENHEVLLLVKRSDVDSARTAMSRYEKLFGLHLSKIQIKESLIPNGNMLQRIQETREYDVLFAMTDGSFFPTLAKKSYLIIQVPWTRSLSIPEQLKLASWSSILVYSDFVKKILMKSWQTRKIQTLSPYVDSNDFQPDTKEKLILNVGRFFSHSQSNSKRQDILVEAFKELVDSKHLKNWELALVGNVDPNPDSIEFVQKLKKSARGYCVSIHQNVTYDELKALNARASFYWHGAGFETNEIQHPENTEHFGITTLEAMASGAIPLVVPKGGQAEIVTDDQFHFETIDELAQKTYQLIKTDATKIKHLRKQVREEATKYSKEKFEEMVKDLV